MECYNCGKQVHPEYHCTTVEKYKDEDDKSTKTNVSRASVKKLLKYMNKIIRAFTMVNTQLQQLKEDFSDLSESEEEDE